MGCLQEIRRKPPYFFNCCYNFPIVCDIINYMGKNRAGRSKKNKRPELEKKKKEFLNLDPETKRGIVAVFVFTFAILVALSFGELAGKFGENFYKYSNFLLGKGTFLIPIVLVAAGLIILKFIHRNVYLTVTIGAVIFIFGFLSLVHVLFPDEMKGGYVGYVISWPFLYLMGKWASFIVFLALILISVLIAFNIPLKKSKKDEEKKLEYPDELEELVEPIPGQSGLGNFFKKVLLRPKFKVKSLEKEIITNPEKELITTISHPPVSDYKFPPLEILEKDKGSPSSGDVRINAGIIQRTLENFGIQVEMSEVNVGPTVTQYTLRPASGVKLSSIVALHKDLSLALAAHPIRIEAPIPGRSLVGIEIPNKAAALVRLGSLLEGIDLRKDLSRLNLVLGRDVAGNPVWADLAKMPHLLIAGATGSGKSICINTIIATLLYQKTPR